MRRRAPLVALLLLAACNSGSSASPLSVSPSPSPSSSPVPSVSPAESVKTVSPPRPAPHAYSLQKLGGFSSPVWAGPAPGDNAHLFLVEKTGKVLQLNPNGVFQSTVLDLTGKVSKGNEQGLLSVAFDPRYASNHRLYADYTDVDGDTVVAAYTVVGGKATDPTTLLTVDQPFANHNGGLLLFDRTGSLLVGLGDGGSGGDPGNRAQDLGTDLGKLLRLDPQTGAGAAGNPFPSRPKVWAYGLRNPWRFAFDSNGDLYLGDVGQNEIEELDVVAPAAQSGANYGWSVYEGDQRFKKGKELATDGHEVRPALTYTHASGGCSITGGEVYRGTVLKQLVGTYVFGDYCAGKLLTVTRTATGVTASKVLGPKVDGLQSFGHDARGELLVLSADALYRLR